MCMRTVTIIHADVFRHIVFPPSLLPLPLPLPLPLQPSDWVVTPDIKAKYDTYFEGIDHDHDGIVNGDQAKGLFMASGLPGNVLAHVW